MKLKSRDYNGVYSDMIQQFDEELVKEIHKLYRGQQVTFPMRLYSKEYVLNYISENYNGENIKKLSMELNYSERWVKKLIDNNNIEFKVE